MGRFIPRTPEQIRAKYSTLSREHMWSLNEQVQDILSLLDYNLALEKERNRLESKREELSRQLGVAQVELRGIKASYDECRAELRTHKKGL